MNLQECYEMYRDDDDMGGDKGGTHSYIPIYEKYMDRRTDVCLLEIGVHKGHSLMMWQRFFNGDSLMDNAFILGVDVTLENLIHPVNVYLGDITKSEVAKAVRKPIFGDSWDYIIDDGSHAVEDQIAAFVELFPALKKGAIYFIEDITGDEGIEKLTAAIPGGKIYDFRESSGRWDDILLVMEK